MLGKKVKVITSNKREKLYENLLALFLLSLFEN